MRGSNLTGSEKFDRLVNGELVIFKSKQTIARTKFNPGLGVNGRGLTVYGADPNNPTTRTIVRDCLITANGDDGFSAWDYTRDTRVENCLFTDVQAGTGARALQTKAALIGSAPEIPAPDYLDWISFTNCTFAAFGRAPEQKGGVARYRRCVFRPSSRNTWTDAKANIKECDFVTSDKPHDATWWDVGRPIVLRNPLLNSIYVDVETCTLNGRPITSPNDLFRLWQDYVNGSVGDVDVPPETFRSRPWGRRV